MKTIADAHKELKGDLKNIVDIDRSDKYLFFHCVEMRYTSRTEERGQPLWCEYICTFEEFNNYKGDEMKDVFDAVIYYGGRNFVNGKHEKHHTHILHGRVSREFYTAYASDIGVGNVICSIQEFNTLVEHLASNKGRSTQTYADYKKEFEYMTTQQIIDLFKDAPEGSTHMATSGKFFKMVRGKFAYYTCGVQHGGWVVDYQPQPLLTNLITRPVTSPTPLPTYTKSIWEAGILPCVGMSCMIYYNETDSRFNDFFDCEIEILAVTGDVFTFINPLKGLGALKLELKIINPIDTRTDTEKAIDDLLDECKRSSTHDGVINNVFNAIKAGKIHGVTFTGKS
jgi:hypothetical protein